MYKLNKLIFKFFLICIVFTVFVSCIPIKVVSIGFYENYFYPNTEKSETIFPENKYREFIESLPEKIKEKFPEDIIENDIISNSKKFIDFGVIWRNILDGLKSTLLPSLKSIGTILFVLLIGVVIRQLKTASEDKGISKVTDVVINVGLVIAILGTDIISFETVENFKNVLCNIMNGLIPVFGIVYASSGNGSTAAIQSGGIMLIVTLCHTIFTKILIPAVRICLVMSITGTIFPDSGIVGICGMIKNITIGIMTVCVTLFSFILSLQNTIAQSVDSIGMRSIKFAVGNLVPIIGGAVSDSLGTVGGSLTLLKNAGGSIIIIILVMLILPVILSLFSRMISLYLCKIFATVMGCKNEAILIDELGGTVSMLLAFCTAMSISFIFVMTLFTSSTLAIMS